MALLYPWATKEYLLWEMSLPQIILYHNLGMELKYGKQEDKPIKPSEMEYHDLKALRDELRQTYGKIGNEGEANG